jgi:hypothetical protein
VIQLNHPRPREGELDDGSYFSHLGAAGVAYRPDQPLTASPNARLLEPTPGGTTRPIDFDAIEVINGEPYGQHPWELMRADWYSLLRQGHRKTGTANSDTHGPGQLAAYPRSYVALRRAALTPETLDAAVLGGRLFGTTGPLITRFRVGGVGMGEMAIAGRDPVRVSVQVSAAPWVPVDEVRILVNGEIHRYFRGLPQPPGAPVVRLDTEIQLSLPADAFITIEAGAPLGIDSSHWIRERGGIYSDVAPDFVSIAFTNPIYVDVDGDGRFEPPGVVGNSELPLGWLLASVAVVAAWYWRRSRSEGA